MSAMRIHRLRALAVQKLAQAYKADEIASSVMVMQGGSVFDDVAERVLKIGQFSFKIQPSQINTMIKRRNKIQTTRTLNTSISFTRKFHLGSYLLFFPKLSSQLTVLLSSQLAESTTTHVLDELIAAYPQRLEYYRTRGIVHCFREEFPQAVKDFTHALKEARALRKAKTLHHHNGSQNDSRNTKHGKRRKGSSSASHTNGQAPPDGTSAMENGVDGSDGEPLLKHPSVLEDAPDPIEPQLLFHRGAAYLQHTIQLIETAVLHLEGVRKTNSIDGAELRLCYIENGKYGGVEIGNPDGPLGKRSGPKLQAYTEMLGEKSFRDNISQLLKRSLRDHEKFLSHFDSLESPNAIPDGDLAFQTEFAFLLSESVRPGNHANMPPPVIPDVPAMFTTYHPLLVESHFSVLICQLMLADFSGILPTFIRTASVVDGLEGYPIFLPPRSMAQAEFIEILERLAGGWKNGVQPHSLSAQRGKSRLAIEGPPPLAAFPSYASLEKSILDQDNEDDVHAAAGSSSSSIRKVMFSSNGVNGSGSSANFACIPLTQYSHLNDSASQSTLATSSSSSSSSPGSPTIPPPISMPTERRRADAVEALDCARMLLAPVFKRQRERFEKAAAEKAALGGKKKPVPINIPLHGPRVEVILAWLGAVHLAELDGM